ncbi:hypothetical protein [Aliamphritea hakodatensis]|uniref:hypothetical protein n=1 Tax=Aliamphritea hakodatensis TaxID=2895352 RepID=UPI0022FDAAE6|nr:hypothetical protein [Aliamphritea hakodatensis]
MSLEFLLDKGGHAVVANMVTDQEYTPELLASILNYSPRYVGPVLEEAARQGLVERKIKPDVYAGAIFVKKQLNLDL